MADMVALTENDFALFLRMKEKFLRDEGKPAPRNTTAVAGPNVQGVKPENPLSISSGRYAAHWYEVTTATGAKTLKDQVWVTTPNGSAPDPTKYYDNALQRGFENGRPVFSVGDTSFIVATDSSVTHAGHTIRLSPALGLSLPLGQDNGYIDILPAAASTSQVGMVNIGTQAFTGPKTITGSPLAIRAANGAIATLTFDIQWGTDLCELEFTNVTDDTTTVVRFFADGTNCRAVLYGQTTVSGTPAYVNATWSVIDSAGLQHNGHWGTISGLVIKAGLVISGSVTASLADGDYGDIVVSGSGAVLTIDADVVGNTKLTNMAEATVKGRAAGAGTGDPTDLTATQLVAIIATADGAGSGLDADLLDGLSSGAFALASHTHASTDITDFAEAVDDRVAVLAVAGTGMTVTYSDVANTLTFATTITQYTDEMVDDRVAALLVQGANITLTYDDVANTLTIAAAGSSYTDEQAQDAVGAMAANSARVTLTYVDATPSLTPDLVADSITAGYLHASATDKLFGRSTAGAGAGEEIACTAFARSILDDANEATFKATVNLEAGVDYQAFDATLTALAGLTIAANSLTIGTGADAFSQTTFAANTFPARASTGNLVAKAITDFGLSLVDDADAAAGRATLGLGTIATQNSNNVSITGGTINTTGSVQTGVLGLYDTDLSATLGMICGENLTSNRDLTIIVGDANRTLTLGGNTTLNGGTHSGTNTGDDPPWTDTATKTAAYTAANKDHVLVDSNGAAGNFAVTLPASPTAGMRVKVTMITDHATRKVTIASNASNIMGSTVETPYDLCVEGDTLEFRYVGGDCGWAVLDGIRPHNAKMFRNTSQTGILTSTATKIALNSESWDMGAIADPTTNNRFVIRRAGRYLAQASMAFDTSYTVDEELWVAIYVNGVNQQWQLMSAGNSAGAAATQIFEEYTLAAGDTVELYVYQITGGTMATSTTLTYQPRMQVIEQRF